MSVPKQVIAAAEARGEQLRTELTELDHWLASQLFPAPVQEAPRVNKKAKPNSKANHKVKKASLWTPAKREAARKRMKKLWANKRKVAKQEPAEA